MRLYSSVLYYLCYWYVIGVGSQRTVAETSNVTEERSVEMEMSGVVRRLRLLGVEARGHAVRAADGTTLRVVRAGQPAAAPVLLAHGLLQASTAWFDAGPASLATLLAANYDLWLLNARGSTLSRPPPSPEHWRFSVDDMGRYDLPTLIDYILSYTGKTQLAYIGFSQGAGSFFIMCSERPEYCDKVNLMVALAPATRMLHTKSILFRITSLFFENYEEQLNANGIWEALPRGGLVQALVNTICTLPNGGYGFCELFKDFLDAPNPGSITGPTLQSAMTGTPAGTSVHNLAWYGQRMKSKNFSKFDYGPKQNLNRYGTEYAPSYNLSAVTTPTVILYGKNDGVVDEKDVKWLVKRLPNVVKVYEMEDPLWTHLDFVMSKKIPTLLFPKLRDCIGS